MSHLQSRSGPMLMDHGFPNWELVIDTDRLDIESDRWCIFGQLFGSFKKGCKVLGLTLEDAVQLGFHAPQGSTKAEARAYYARSNQLWRIEIERRMPAYV